MFCCSSCYPKVNGALAQYTKNYYSDSTESSDRLALIEEKLAILSNHLESLASNSLDADIVNVSASQNTLIQE